MDQCPLCESFALVAVEKPCSLCGLSLIQTPSDRTVAIVPGWFLFDLPKPRFPETMLSRLIGTTENLILDFSQVSVLRPAGIRVLVELNSAVRESKLNLILVNVRQSVMELFKVSRLSNAFRIVADIEGALETL